MKKSSYLIMAALAVGAGAGLWIGNRLSQPDVVLSGLDAHAATTPARSDQPLYWRNPMNPAITSPVFTKDSMGMDYIPVYADGGEGADEPAGTVSIDPVTVQNIGVRTAKAKTRTFSRSIRALGRVVADESRISRLHPKIEGWIESLLVNKTGELVRKGDVLFSVYSPKLVTSQHEYLLALHNLKALGDSEYPDLRDGARRMAEISRRRLQLLDVPEHQIRELEKTGKIFKALHVHSPFDGVVMDLNVSEGDFVTPRNELYRLADLSKVWVQTDVYEYELPWVQVGDSAKLSLKSMPGRGFTGTVSYIYPYAEAKTRTVKVRLEMDNSELSLKPDMFADVTLSGGLQEEAVVVPDEAIVRSGVREQVFVVREPGKFEPRNVTLGQSSEGWVQVLDGVSAGEEIVTSALFLIDSESKLREATSKMVEASSGGTTAGEADDMDMQDMIMEKAQMGADASVRLDMAGLTLQEGMNP